MRLAKLPLVLGLALSALAVASPSRAQTTTTTEPDGYIYDFKDDYMVGDTISTMTSIIQVRKRAARVTLIRPRASFVAEMLKSVEVL